MSGNLEDYYEDVGDPLAEFRKKVGGGMYASKKGKLPIDKDPDVLQSKRQKKLEREEEKLNGFGGY